MVQGLGLRVFYEVQGLGVLWVDSGFLPTNQQLALAGGCACEALGETSSVFGYRHPASDQIMPVFGDAFKTYQLSRLLHNVTAPASSSRKTSAQVGRCKCLPSLQFLLPLNTTYIGSLSNMQTLKQLHRENGESRVRNSRGRSHVCKLPHKHITSANLEKKRP